MSATGATIRSIDLDDLAASVDEETSQAGAVRAGSFDTKCCRRTERVRPLEQLCVATRAGPNRETAQHAPERVERCGDVKISVGVDSHDNTLGSLCDPDVCHPRPRDAGNEVGASAAGGRTGLGRASCTGSYQVTFAPLIAPTRAPGHGRRIIGKAMRPSLEESVRVREVLGDIIPVS